MINKNYLIYIRVSTWLDKLTNFSDIENWIFFFKSSGDLLCTYCSICHLFNSNLPDRVVRTYVRVVSPKKPSYRPTKWTTSVSTVPHTNWVSSPMLTFAIEFTNICNILSKSKTKKPMLSSYSAFYQTKLSQTYYSVSEVKFTCTIAFALEHSN